MLSLRLDNGASSTAAAEIFLAFLGSMRFLESIDLLTAATRGCRVVAGLLDQNALVENGCKDGLLVQCNGLFLLKIFTTERRSFWVIAG